MQYSAHAETMKQITNAIADGVLTINLNGKILFANSIAESMFGYEPNKLEGVNVNSIIPKQIIMNGAARSPSSKEHLTPTTREVIGMSKTGKNFYLEIGLRELHFLGNKVLIGVVRDLTARKAFEAGLIIAKEAAEAANRSKSEFLANMSHDLRTPLHIIGGLTDIITNRLTKLTQNKNQQNSGSLISEVMMRKTQTQLSFIKESQQRQLALIDDLLDLAKLESGEIELNIKATNITNLITHEITEIKPIADQNNQKIKLTTSEPSLLLMIDENKISQVIQNLLSNAIKFSNSNCTTTIIVEKNNPKNIRITISDQGCGIPNNERSLIFNKFSQSSETRLNRKGTGLGLAICKKIINLHKGEISCKNNQSIGACFEIILPKDQG